MRIKDILSEVRIIPKSGLEAPLKSNDTIRVYHGTNKKDAINMVISGFTGDQKANRAYSYERVNNPKGLFVSPRLDVAKRFGHFVLEMHVLVSDLEPPAWASDDYELTRKAEKYFKDPSERIAKQQQMRSQSAKSSDPMIANSDDPYLADILTDLGEPQALFVGNVNPANIKNIWVNKDPKIAPRWSDFERISLRDFKKTYGSEAKSKEFFTPLFNPRDIPSLEDFAAAVAKSERDLTFDEVIEILKDMDNSELEVFLGDRLWSDSQKQQIKTQLSK